MMFLLSVAEAVDSLFQYYRFTFKKQEKTELMKVCTLDYRRGAFGCHP